MLDRDKLGTVDAAHYVLCSTIEFKVSHKYGPDNAEKVQSLSESTV